LYGFVPIFIDVALEDIAYIGRGFTLMQESRAFLHKLPHSCDIMYVHFPKAMITKYFDTLKIIPYKYVNNNYRKSAQQYATLLSALAHPLYTLNY
jgi:hypothetical protein